MSDNFYKNLSTIFGFLAMVLLFILLLFIANLEIKDLDLWLHIGMGRTIVQNNFQVPQVDILSCTIAGKPWVNHEWLFQVLVYFIHRFWGPDGLIFMQVIVVALTMIILFVLGYNREKQLASIFSLLLVALVYQQRFTIRPDLFSLLFFVVYILILSFYLDRKWSMVVLVLVQILWTNVHGFFFFGPLFVLIGIIAEWMKRKVKLPYQWNRISRLTDEEYRRLRMIFWLTVLACLVNPMTFRGAWYPIQVFFQLPGESKVFFERIVELKRPISWGNIFSSEQYPYYKLLILISFVSFVFNRRKIDLSALFIWLIFLFFSLAAVRNMIYFAFAAYLVFINNTLNLKLQDVAPLKITDHKFVYMTSTVVKIFLAIWIIQYGITISTNGYFDFDKYERKSEFGGVSQRAFPNKAVDFLLANQVRGNFFNDFNSGAYLVGRCFPQIKVFIDGRTEVYGPQFFKYYQGLWEKENKKAFAEMLEKYRITGVLLNSVYQPIPRHALKVLYQSPDWVPVYLDYDAMIFLKNVPQNKTVIDHYRLNLTQWQAKTMDLLRVGSKKVTPYQNINRAYTLLDLGIDDAAKAEAEAALKVEPCFFEPYKILGKVYGRKQEHRLAFENFRIATTLVPHDRLVRNSLAQSLYDLEAYPYAIDQYQRIIDRWPNEAKPYFRLARCYVKVKKYARAQQVLQQGFRLDPKRVTEVVRVGVMVRDDQQYDLAKKMFELALTGQRDLKKAHQELGILYERLGEPEKAQGEFATAAALDLQDKQLTNKEEEWESEE
jgi:Tfp pilus assembly protein PilF